MAVLGKSSFEMPCPVGLSPTLCYLVYAEMLDLSIGNVGFPLQFGSNL